MKIVDCFLFSHELDMLELRLELLSPFVDLFVLVESPETFSGIEKPLYFEQHKGRFAKWRNIMRVVAPPLETSDPWEREKFQRNCLFEATHNMHVGHPDCVILLSDVDEFPHPRLFKSLPALVKKFGCLTLDQAFYYYSLEWKCTFSWKGTVAVHAREWGKHTPEWWRRSREGFDFVTHGGWHLSYFGGVAAIQQKVKGFSHQEFNQPNLTSPEHIRMCVQEGHDIFFRNPEEEGVILTSQTPIPSPFMCFVEDPRFARLLLGPRDSQKPAEISQTPRHKADSARAPAKVLEAEPTA